jgi:hypothetical protein
MTNSPNKPIKALLLLGLALLAVGLVAGCGGGSSSSSTSAEATSTGPDPVAAAGTAATAGAGEGSEAGEVQVARHVKAAAAEKAAAPDPVTEGKVEAEIQVGQFPNGKDTDEISATGAKPIEPCALVSTRQAEAILGSKVNKAERPQGPTCVYSAAGRTVTLAVERNSLRSLREEARKATKVKAGGVVGWCLRYSTTSVVFPVDRTRVLQVGGPCAAGVRFAGFALKRL